MIKKLTYSFLQIKWMIFRKILWFKKIVEYKEVAQQITKKKMIFIILEKNSMNLMMINFQHGKKKKLF